MQGANSLWFTLLKAHYGDITLKVFGGNSRNTIATSPSSSSSIWWRNLLSYGSNEGTDPFEENCKFDLGKGFTTSFWEARWMDDMCLKDSFPDLFMASVLKKVAVAGMRGWVDEGWRWGGLGIDVSLLSPVSRNHLASLFS